MLRLRSMMFVPGGRADMIAKVGRFAPDVAVVDLEDALAAADKDEGRCVTARSLAALQPPTATTVLVRVNPVGTPWFAPDVSMAASSPADGVVLPKLARSADLAALQAELARHGRPEAVIIGGIETGLGVADARRLIPGLNACYFGAEDYIADLAGHRTAVGLEVLYARSQVCLAAHLAGVPAIDQAVVSVTDEQQFLADARDGAALGYQGKICIHPSQVRLAHEVFTPSAPEIAHARAVLAAAAGGVGVLDGQMVDDVHVRMAHTVLRRAGGAA